MNQKTILLVDDEQEKLEALADALEFEGYRLFKARTMEQALLVLSQESVDLVTVDIMMPAGDSMKGRVSSHESGIVLCEEITRTYPGVDIFCLSVVSDRDVIRKVENLGVKFLRKGETPLRTVLDLIRSRVTGIAYSTDRGRR